MSAGVSSILLSLQRTAALTGTTQTRLATGKKVNSALDDPSSYFTALSLGARAGTLAARLDNIGQAQNTLKAANHGLEAVTKLVQAAQSLAQQARQSPLQQTSYAAIDQVGSVDISAEAQGSVTGNVDISGGFLGDVNGLQIQVGASTFTVNHPGMSNAAAIVSAINSTAGLGANGAGGGSPGRHGPIHQTDGDQQRHQFHGLADRRSNHARRHLACPARRPICCKRWPACPAPSSPLKAAAALRRPSRSATPARKSRRLKNYKTRSAGPTCRRRRTAPI